MSFYFRECNSEDLDELRDLSIRTYTETFADFNTEENMNEYLNRAYNRETLRDELMNSASKFYFLHTRNNLVGYLKLNKYRAQTDIKDPESIELERIYVVKEFQGNGFGKVLMEKAIEVAVSSQKKYLWLGVWEKNTKALNFYKKKGFYAFGKHLFVMGDDEQTDYILRKDLV